MKKKNLHSTQHTRNVAALRAASKPSRATTFSAEVPPDAPGEVTYIEGWLYKPAKLKPEDIELLRQTLDTWKQEDDCLTFSYWTCYGDGVVQLSPKRWVRVDLLVWHLAGGEEPSKGKKLLHSCGNPCCANGEHLSLPPATVAVAVAKAPLSSAETFLEMMLAAWEGLKNNSFPRPTLEAAQLLWAKTQKGGK